LKKTTKYAEKNQKNSKSIFEQKKAYNRPRFSDTVHPMELFFFGKFYKQSASKQTRVFWRCSSYFGFFIRRERDRKKPKKKKINALKYF